jgi:hypothetical protein
MNQGEAKPTGNVEMKVIRGGPPAPARPLDPSLWRRCSHTTSFGQFLHKVIGW